MKHFALLLFITLLGINIFSLVIFNYSMNHIEGGCIASVVDGTDCPTNIADFTFHKITAIKTFSNTLTTSGFVLPILFSIITFSFFLFLIFEKLKYFKIKFLSQRWRILSFSFLLKKLKSIFWFSLLENSPNF